MICNTSVQILFNCVKFSSMILSYKYLQLTYCLCNIKCFALKSILDNQIQYESYLFQNETILKQFEWIYHNTSCITHNRATIIRYMLSSSSKHSSKPSSKSSKAQESSRASSSSSMGTSAEKLVECSLECSSFALEALAAALATTQRRKYF